MKINKLHLAIAIAMLALGSAQAQVDSTMQYAVSLLPQYLITDGLRVDLEKKIAPQQWVQFGPQVYYGNYEGDENTRGYATHTGLGFTTEHKYYFRQGDRPLGFYMAYGLDYQHHWLKVDATAWNIEVQDGYEVLTSNPIKAMHIIDKMGLNLIMGMQEEVYDHMVVNIFGGLGLRHSIHQMPEGANNRFNDWHGDLGFSGAILVAGLKFGFVF